MAGIVNTALPKATFPSNIINGFKVSGIFPFNKDNFQESDFLGSSVTDRPDPTTMNTTVEEDTTVSNHQRDEGIVNYSFHVLDIDEVLEPFSMTLSLSDSIGSPEFSVSLSPSTPAEASTSSGNLVDSSHHDLEPVSYVNAQIFDPEVVAPFPKAPPRKSTNRGRPKRQSAVLTDTPVRNALALEKSKKQKEIKPKEKTVRRKLTLPQLSPSTHVEDSTYSAPETNLKAKKRGRPKRQSAVLTNLALKKSKTKKEKPRKKSSQVGKENISPPLPV